jgi:hypothetical protein
LGASKGNIASAIQTIAEGLGQIASSQEPTVQAGAVQALNGVQNLGSSLAQVLETLSKLAQNDPGEEIKKLKGQHEELKTALNDLRQEQQMLRGDHQELLHEVNRRLG